MWGGDPRASIPAFKVHDDIPLPPHDDTPVPREPLFDDDGNLLSENDPQSVSSTFEESSSENSLHGHSRSSDHNDDHADVGDVDFWYVIAL